MLLWSKGDGGGLDGSGRDDQGQTLGGGGGGVVAKSCPTLATPWTVALQVPLSMGFSRQGILEWVAISFSNYILEFTYSKASTVWTDVVRICCSVVPVTIWKYPQSPPISTLDTFCCLC